MMNLQFQVISEDEHGNPLTFQGTPYVKAQISGYPARLRQWAEDTLEDAVRIGYDEARKNAPENKTAPGRNGIQTIRESIQMGGTTSHRGGAGGGATIEKELFADGFTAPHLRFVFEGTGQKTGGGHEVPIRFSQSTKLHYELKRQAERRGESTSERMGGSGEFLAKKKTYTVTNKEGETEIRYGRWFRLEKEDLPYRATFSGQAPQQQWWYDAIDAMNAKMEEAAANFADEIQMSPFNRAMARRMRS